MSRTEDGERGGSAGAPGGPPEPKAAAGGVRALLERATAQAQLAWSLVRLQPFDTDTPVGRSNERYRRIALTTISSVVVRGVGAVLGLVTVPVVLGYLGKERFGLWSTITTLVAWITLFDFGIANGLVNVLSGAHGRDDREQAGRYVSTALALLTGVAVLLLVAAAIATPLVPWAAVLAVRGAVEPSTVAWAVLAAIGTFAVSMPLSVVPQIYSAYQRAYVTNAFALAGVLFGFGTILLTVAVGAKLPALVVAFGIGGVASSAAALLYAFSSMPWLRLRRSWVTREAARGLMSRSFPLFLFQLGALTVNETQAIVLAHRCDLAVVADYSIVMRVYVLAMSVVQMSTASFLPSFREAAERGDHLWFRASFVQFLRARMALAAAAALVLAFAGNALLKLWLRRSDVTFQPAVWAMLAVLMIATAWATAHGDLLTIMDRLWVNVGLVMFNGAVTVALTYVLAPRYQVLGVVMATAFVIVGFYSWLVPLLARALVLRR